MPDSLETAVLHDDGTVPNSSLPVVIYRAAVKPDARDPAATFERVFEENGWGGTWRNGIYDSHHYHSTTHEVLGLARGRVKVQLGGPKGRMFDLEAGDVVVLPAGTAHKNLGASDDLLVVGAYPVGQEPDMNYGRAGERPQADERIACVPLPESDPVGGGDGPLLAAWRAVVR